MPSTKPVQITQEAPPIIFKSAGNEKTKNNRKDKVRVVKISAFVGKLRDIFVKYRFFSVLLYSKNSRVMIHFEKPVLTLPN